MRTFGTRMLASILVGLLSTSCGMVRESWQSGSDDEIFFLPRAPRALASPVVERAEVLRAIEDLLPSLDVKTAQAELRLLVADPRFHDRRIDELRVVQASWGSGPVNLEEITSGYRAWCRHSGRTDCITRPLTESDVYQVAFDFALGAEWNGFAAEIKSTIDPSTVRTVLLIGMVIFMATLAFPELTSKIPAGLATAILTAYLGARVVCDLIFGWIQMVRELDAATTFDEVRAAGVRYGLKVGVQTARVLVLLATAAAAQGGLIARLMKLPHARQASAALATETGGVGLEVVGQIKEVRVLQSGVAITVQGAAKGAVGVAMASHSPPPGSGTSKPPPGGGAGAGFRAFTEDNFRTNLARLTGGIPKGADAHHVFPQKFAEKFSRAGINIHDPRFGAWWETTAHQRASSAYNAKWEDFFRKNRFPSAEQILKFGRKISEDHGLHVGF